MPRKKMLVEKFYLQSGNMSRLGKKPIEIPQGVEVTVSGKTVTVKGPKGTLSRDFNVDLIKAEVEGNEVVVSKVKENKVTKALWGTYASHISNMIEGVTKGFEKKLVVEGVGFKSEVQGNNLVLDIGFSHKVNVSIPEGLTVTAEKNEITITGIDKDLVGQFTAEIRAKKKPEPYKGKGIRYIDEVIRRKQGKKTVV